jgi:hypothetical protein
LAQGGAGGSGGPGAVGAGGAIANGGGEGALEGTYLGLGTDTSTVVLFNYASTHGDNIFGTYTIS